MSIALFVPEIWSARLLRHLDATLVYGQPAVTNRNWEGEIREKGNTVRINKVGNPRISDYVKGTPMTPERPRGTGTDLTIDRDKSFYVQMDDLDRVQVNVPLFDEFTRRAGIQMAKTYDADIASRMVAGAGVSVGDDATPVVIDLSGGGDFSSFRSLTAELGRVLDNNDAPDDGRWVAINPDIRALIRDDDRLIPPGAAEQRTGEIGEVNGFTIYRTTAVPTSPGSGGAPVANSKILFGAGNYATTIANQLVETEAERLQGLFEDAVKGRNVWGARVVEPETLGCAHVARGA